MEPIPLFNFGDGQPKLCTIPAFARANNIPINTLYSATHSGRIIHTRIGGRLYINHESAQKFLRTYRAYTEE